MDTSSLTSDNGSRYWLDLVLDQVQEKFPTGDITTASGITPSGPYHVGHAREILTAEAIRRGLELRGRKAQHIHSVDDFDALRKRYDWLPESYEAEAGKPVYLVPAPDGKSKSYAEQFFAAYADAAERLSIPMQIWRSHQEYQAGVFADLITTALARKADIARILETVSQRELPADWQPIQILDAATQSLRTATFRNFDAATGLVEYTSGDGSTQQADIKTGQIKLDWRVDWPARWSLLGVQVEGFGKEHATKGGSYDTGAAICREVFEAEPPIAVPFNPINLKGDNRKMSSSIGNLITIDAALEFIPPEILRYFVFKSLPTKVLDFDPGLGMYNLVDEFASTEAQTLGGETSEFTAAWKVSVLDPKQATVSSIPFSHLVATYQATQQSKTRTLELLAKTHAAAVRDEAEVIKRELDYIGRWLETDYPPESVVFALQTELPQLEVSAEQAEFLEALAVAYPAEPEAEVVQTLIFETARQLELPPRSAFTLLYQLFIGKTAGPKLGGFLASLPRDFVVGRLQQNK